jgi:beta-ribofuranosylaminobenzene 5'-phosphate synthase
MATVETGARLHFGFQNLSLAHERLYGGIGVGLNTPQIVVEAEEAASIHCDDAEALPYVGDAVGILGVPGATVTVHDRYERHIGLGSGTQLALASLVAIAEAYDLDVDTRELAPQLGRGGRSGVGVATFESGGFVVETGHPTERFTTAPPDRGEWTVPEPLGVWQLPDEWRFLLIQPAAKRGLSGENEDDRMRTIVERADPGIADEIATLLTRRLLPAVVEADLDTFASAVSRLGRLNGAWYADEQGGVYRPPAGKLIERLDGHPAIAGCGQSSWGSTVYAVTRAATLEEAKAAGKDALDDIADGGTFEVAKTASEGARLR